jgi:hypothetical protein
MQHASAACRPFSWRRLGPTPPSSTSPSRFGLGGSPPPLGASLPLLGGSLPLLGGARRCWGGACLSWGRACRCWGGACLCWGEPAAAGGEPASAGGEPAAAGGEPAAELPPDPFEGPLLLCIGTGCHSWRAPRRVEVTKAQGISGYPQTHPRPPTPFCSCLPSWASAPPA